MFAVDHHVDSDTLCSRGLTVSILAVGNTIFREEISIQLEGMNHLKHLNRYCRSRLIFVLVLLTKIDLVVDTILF